MKLPSTSQGRSQLVSENTDYELKQILRSIQLKVTDQRLLILRAIKSGHRHFTVQELFELVQGESPDLGFATVYRFLRDLAAKGVVSETRVGSESARYELVSKEHHDHLSCRVCGKICEFENQTIEALQEKIAQEFGFILTDHVLELYGICPECQKKKNLA